jgi:hypothetical protein
MLGKNPLGAAGRVCSAAAAVLLALVASSPARAANHFWHISEVYSNADGSVQFIEMHNDFGGEGFIANLTLEARNAGATQTHTFTFSDNTDDLFETADKHVLIATDGFGSLPGAVAPDFMLPAGFLFIDGGSLDYPASGDSISYAAMPTDGTTSLTRDLSSHALGPALNSPTNFAGQSGSVVPEPGVGAAMVVGIGATLVVRRRRS